MYTNMKGRFVTISKQHKRVEIVSKKHDGSIHRRWLENVIAFDEADVIIGYNEYTPVIETDRREWVTDTKAIFYFHRTRWFNVIVMLTEPYYYYCNISSPVMYKERTIEYIDYDIDVIVHNDFSYEVVDEKEFMENKRRYNYPNDIVNEVYMSLNSVRRMIEAREAPFNNSFVAHWSRTFFS